jgi:hypothetical protein
MKTLAGVVLALSILLLLPTGAHAQPISDCGTLIQGVECILFDSDNFGVYIVGLLGSHGVGDRVHVTGTIDPNCVSFCQQGDGCINGAVISSCESPTISDCGTLIRGVECILFDSDHFGVYILLGSLGGHGVGDRIHVSGTIPPECISICMQGDGCIENPVITSCDIPTLSEWGFIVFGALLLIGIGVMIRRRRLAAATY